MKKLQLRHLRYGSFAIEQAPGDARRRVVLLGLGSFVTTQLLSACGGGGGSSGASQADQSGNSRSTSTTAATDPSASASAAPAAAPATTAAAPSASTSTAASSSTATTTSSSAPAATSPSTASSSTKTASSTTTAASSSAAKFVTGVFSGGFDPSTAEAYDKWLGKETGYNVDFITDTNTDWDIAQWAPLKKAQPANNMLLSIPLTDMSGIVAGSYDATYKSIATSIASAYPNAIIRIGWEMNGSWYAWSAVGQPSTYVQAYNRVAAFFRAKSSKFMIEWCPNNGIASNMDCEQAYPGDEYVDCIGMDTYMDYRYGTESSAARWAGLVGGGRGLQWQVSFAKQHEKKLSIPEWGVNSDDPTFIENMHSWLVTYDYHHASYWDSNADFQGQLSSGQYPNAAAAFKSLFGA